MRTWARSAIDRSCGGPCGQRIERGDPILLITVPMLKTPRVRCAKCAGQPVPENLPELDARPMPKPAPIPVMRRLGMLPVDEREPGEEG